MSLFFLLYLSLAHVFSLLSFFYLLSLAHPFNFLLSCFPFLLRLFRILWSFYIYMLFLILFSLIAILLFNSNYYVQLILISSYYDYFVIIVISFISYNSYYSFITLAVFLFFVNYSPTNHHICLFSLLWIPFLPFLTPSYSQFSFYPLRIFLKMKNRYNFWIWNPRSFVCFPRWPLIAFHFTVYWSIFYQMRFIESIFDAVWITSKL